jgi:hypothetical protein
MRADSHQTCVLRMVVNGESSLQISVKLLNLASLGVVGRGCEMPNAPREAQMIELL